MSEQTISQLLKHYTLGDAFASRRGIRCYPATDIRTGIRYIVKVQSFPYSQAVTEAFILSGAFASEADVNRYYGDLAKDLCRQAAILNALSHSAYFSHITHCETVQLEDVGYEVWLIAPYRKTLAAIFDKVQLTQDEILQLGISLCRALAICRKAGYLYTGIKPENIYVSESGEFTIGDIGFIPLASLPYATLPIGHRTIYTPADCHDPFTRISNTLDVYGVGVVLYQAFSGGKLPDKIIDPPQNTSKEIANIIMTACAPSANQRWNTPEEMEMALLSNIGTQSYDLKT